MPSYATAEEIDAARLALEAGMNGYEAPAAYGLGVATVGRSGAVLDVWYPTPGLGPGGLFVAALAEVTGYRATTTTAQLSTEQVDALLELVEPAAACTDMAHPNLEATRSLRGMLDLPEPAGGSRTVVAAIVASLDDEPVDAIDVYLRLHLLSHTLVRPNVSNLTGLFGKLTTCVWTNLGPFEADDFELRRAELKAGGRQVSVHGLDKFPRMTDYVIPPGVRIADANRVRLGAHLSPGTTVMHEGHVNFNAGTLGSSMVEGRITAGVVVGEGSDIGGGASIMGTLSGGGSEVVSVGENCLIGAEGGIGISLGDNCVVAAGVYVTAGTLVKAPDGTVVKARELSGHDNLMFIQHSQTGAFEARVRGDASSWQGLNKDLHDDN